MFLTFAKLGETEFLAGQGRIDDALALVSDALRDAEEFAHLKSPVLRRRADLLAQSGADASEVGAAYRAAIDCARGPRRQILRAAGVDLLYSMAQLAGPFGRRARLFLAKIYGWFTEGFDTPALSEAKALCLTN